MGRRSKVSADRYGAIAEATSADEQQPDENGYVLQQNSRSSEEGGPVVVELEKDGLMRDAAGETDDDQHSRASDSTATSFGNEMSIQELLYSSSSYYAIAKPVTLTMVLAALAVVYVNTEDTVAAGQAAISSAYQVWDVNSDSSGKNLATSLANALVMVSVICAMTFVVVLLYKFKFMKCLIGYMIMCSATLLGILGENLFATAVSIYSIPIDKISFYLFMVNFALVGVLSVFFAKGIPQYVTQGYLIATSVILSWHLSYFDDWTTWTLLFMLAMYDLCAVLTPCGPLKALVTLMSKEDAPEMPGLLYEAELPPEAKRPGTPKRSLQQSVSRDSGTSAVPPEAAEGRVRNADQAVGGEGLGPTVKIPLAIAKVYQLPVISIPQQSMRILYPERFTDSNVSASPLLNSEDQSLSSLNLPADPTPEQLRAPVVVRLPLHGGRIEQVSKRGKKVYLERDRHGNPKRILWVDRKGKVFAEMRSDDEDGPERNSIRLGLGDFIFYSVMVAKAAEYSFATFAAVALVVLAGLGGTLVLLSVYHHALPALPISIILGIIFYLLTRLFVEPWIEAVLGKPYYV
jgi:presenilin 1